MLRARFYYGCPVGVSPLLGKRKKREKKHYRAWNFTNTSQRKVLETLASFSPWVRGFNQGNGVPLRIARQTGVGNQPRVPHDTRLALIIQV